MARLIFIFLVLTVAASAAQFNVSKFVRSNRQIEKWDGRDGRHGERGPWQFLRVTWRQHMPGVPFTQARREGPARVCAERHVDWLRRSLRAAGREDTPFMVALSWNAGLEATLAGRAPASSYDYAERVVNLYSE